MMMMMMMMMMMVVVVVVVMFTHPRPWRSSVNHMIYHNQKNESPEDSC
jgi:uncharacterized membrane protein